MNIDLIKLKKHEEKLFKNEIREEKYLIKLLSKTKKKEYLKLIIKEKFAKYIK